MRSIISTAAILLAGTAVAAAQQKPVADCGEDRCRIVKAFPTASADFKPRFDQDDTMKQVLCERRIRRRRPVADAIAMREKAEDRVPADGKLVGDWKCRRKDRPIRLWIALHRLSRRASRTAATATPAIS